LCWILWYYWMSCRPIIRSKTQLFVSSMLLPHKSKQRYKLKTKNQQLFSKQHTAEFLLSLSDSNTLLTKQPSSHSTFWFNFRHAHISSDCCILGPTALGTTQYTECHTQKNMLRRRVSLRNFCFQNDVAFAGAISAADMCWTSVRYWTTGPAAKYIEANLGSHCCVTSGWHSIAVWFAQIFRFRFSL